MREYVGGGALGQRAAEADAEARRERQRLAAIWTARRARLEDAGELSRRFFDAVERHARGELVLAGYRQHHRGEWRRSREHNADHVGE